MSGERDGSGPGTRQSAAAQGALPTVDGGATGALPAVPGMPNLSLPKGGGAIRGLGESFRSNPVAGTAGLSIPVETTPGRGGFGPALALTYDSGTGNGPSGAGWSLGLPAITRMTERGVPTYDTGTEADRFVLAEHDELLPVLVPAAGDWRRHGDERTLSDGSVWLVRRYRPRVEGAFIRIERWSNRQTGETHWRTISHDNLTTLYGRSAESRIADPADPARRVFSWLVCASYDGKGNAIHYQYRAEDGLGVDPGRPEERNRTALGLSAGRYPKRIRYGNHRPVEPGENLDEVDDWHFEVVFDYGEHDPQAPTPQDAAPWPVRSDPFSTYRAGFEVRTCRRLQRVLVFHHFPEEAVGASCLVRSTDLTYDESPLLSKLTAVRRSGYIRDGARGYRRSSLPPLDLAYSTGHIDETVHDLDPVGQENLPAGLDGGAARWVDLDGEGLAGVLMEQDGGWHYKRNLGGGRLGPLEVVSSRPSTARIAHGRQALLDLGGDGRLDLVQLGASPAGFAERTDEGGWAPFRPFDSLPNLSWGDPNLRFVDLDGDGLSDVLITEGDALVWHPSLGERGFEAGRRVAAAADEERGPRLVFNDGTRSVFLADMSGDGLTDLVRVRNGEVRYWPNLGHGRFGPAVTMGRAPWFDAPDLFDPDRLRLADIDGSGGTDLVYLHADGPVIYANQSGNSWAEPQRLAAFPAVDDVATVSVLDLLGTGTACLVWSSPLAGDAGRAWRYVDLTSGQKPHLLNLVRNNMGGETRIEYTSSTVFHLADKAAGRPWATRLPFPVHCVSRVEATDAISRSRLTTRHAYHHGYFDGEERQFRGFGMVEQWDAEAFDALAPAAGLLAGTPPTHTKTWYHMGADLADRAVATAFGAEFRHDDPAAPTLPSPRLVPGPGPGPDPTVLRAPEAREFDRALKGRPLRVKIFADDASDQAAEPYLVTTHAYRLRREQPHDGDHEAVFSVWEAETLTLHGERTASDPRVQHRLTLEVDEIGNPTRVAEVSYARRPGPDRQPEQQRTWTTVTRNHWVNAREEQDWYRAAVLVDTSTEEVSGVEPPDGRPFTVEGLAALIDAAAPIPYETPATPTIAQRRLISRMRVRHWREDLTGLLAPGAIDRLGLVAETAVLALTPGLLDVYRGLIEPDALTTALRDEGGYRDLDGDGHWWVPSGRVYYAPVGANPPDPVPQDALAAARCFWQVQAGTDPFGNLTRFTYDVYRMLPTGSADPVGNERHAVHDYRVLKPAVAVDPNGNRSAVRFDELGMITATAVMGKENEPDPARRGDTLDDPTTRVEYRFMEWLDHGRPAAVRTLARERHGPGTPRWQDTFVYLDGLGREVQHKVQAEPGTVDGTDVSERWVGTGTTVYNNKGLAVRQYEPFFSATSAFEWRPDGPATTLLYDPLDRKVGTATADHRLKKVVWAPWREEAWDENDCVLLDPATDPDVGPALRSVDPADYLPTWHRARQGNALGAEEARAAELAAAHAATPTVSHLDPLGREVVVVADNGPQGLAATRQEIDVQGRVRVVVDALGRPTVRRVYDLLGTTLRQSSADAGERWHLTDVRGNALRTWDGRGFRTRSDYDELRRQRRLFVRQPGGVEALAEEFVYGESSPGSAERNRRGQVHVIRDGAGLQTNEEFDFKGNLVRSTRQLAREYRQELDWTGQVPLQAEQFVTMRAYDALNRPVMLVTPHGGGVRPSVIQPGYNEAGLPDRLDVWLRRAEAPTRLLDPATADLRAVTDIDYDERGNRTRIAFGNGAVTRYEHDPANARLTRVLTARANGADTLQDLRYTYDPVGNVTSIRDLAQQTVYFNNQVVAGDTAFTYDALYRLASARGREHASAGAPPPEFDDGTRLGRPHPNDGQAVRRYEEAYTYDAVGNILGLLHQAVGGSWNRTYAYDEPNASATTNRLTSTTVGGVTGRYGYDTNGNMTAMPHVAELRCNARDQMRVVDRGGGGRAYSVYDGQGQRLRTVWEKGAGLVEERIYLGPFELFRRSTGGGLDREYETLHLMNGDQRVALIETLTVDGGAPVGDPSPRLRYQHDNLIGSAVLELDHSAQVISYEEYYPFGSTSFQSVRGAVEVGSKRYRFLGKERDEASGLVMAGARRYAPWLGRWTSCDPAGLVDGVNVYAYARNNPVVMVDPEGTMSWAKIFGIAAAVVVGAAVTALTAGALGPVGAGIVAGAFAGAAGEAAEAFAGDQPITARNLLVSAGLGAAFGGIFAGAGQILARTGIGARIGAWVASRAAVQWASRAAYRVTGSTSRPVVAARAAGAWVRRGVERLERAGEWAGRRLGGPFAQNAERQAADRAGLQGARQHAVDHETKGVQATVQGELNGQPSSATTRSGRDKGGKGFTAIETPQGRVDAPAPDAVSDVLRPLPARIVPGATFVRDADAEFKLFGHTLISTSRDSTGRLYLGVTAPICPSCYSNLWNTRAALPGVRILADLPSQTQGAAGALQTFVPHQRDDVPPPMPVLQLQGTFGE
ncbi:SpvB/TcaC N-terminal domain-containing protein [Streptomyces sp. DSM 41634]|uniref:SpvB/TcaC N-terminal domain-containing protein n=1 Tax=Streptomyces sp. DSM 41634 TaxID=3448656 RepID=UPI0028883619|nr:SpvB/TcaC N-terminal domain-containing protein [Streptomyces sp. DSM 41633]